MILLITLFLFISTQATNGSNEQRLIECKAWGQYSKEDNGCTCYHQGFEIISSAVYHDGGLTTRAYASCDKNECYAFCDELYAASTGSSAGRCKEGCDKYEELGGCIDACSYVQQCDHCRCGGASSEDNFKVNSLDACYQAAVDAGVDAFSYKEKFNVEKNKMIRKCAILKTQAKCTHVFDADDNWRIYYIDCQTDNEDAAYVKYSTCQWHQINQWDKYIQDERFFGFECPPNQIISELRLKQNPNGSHKHNDPVMISCCELGGHSVVTDTCTDKLASETDEDIETAVCVGNSAMVAVFDLHDIQTMPEDKKTTWEYTLTKGVTCCDIKYDTAHGIKNDFGINRNDCTDARIRPPEMEGELDVSCPTDKVLVGVEDHIDDVAGVQGMYRIECCGLHDFAAPTQAPTTSEPSTSPTPVPTQAPTTSPSKSPTPSPTQSPTSSPTQTPSTSPSPAPTQAPITSAPSTSPTTSCDDCLAKVHAKEIYDPSCFIREVQACLDLCCVMEY